MLASSLASTVRNVEVCGSEVGEVGSGEEEEEDEDEGESASRRGCVGALDKNGDTVGWVGQVYLCAGR